MLTQTACESCCAGPCDGSVGLRSLIADGRIRSQASTCGICGGQSDTVTVSAGSSIHSTNCIPMGRDSSVGIAARYRLEVRGSNCSEGEIFAPVRTGPGAHPAFCRMGPGGGG